MELRDSQANSYPRGGKTRVVIPTKSIRGLFRFTLHSRQMHTEMTQHTNSAHELLSKAMAATTTESNRGLKPTRTVRLERHPVV